MTRIKALISILSFVIFPSVFAFIDKYLNLGLSDNYLIFSILVYLSTILFIFGLNYKYLILKIQNNLNKKNKPIINGIKGYFLVLLFNLILGLIITYYNVDFQQADNQLELEKLIKNNALFLSFLVIGIIGPLCEELVFRFSILSFLTKDKKTNNFIPYLLTAIIFALIHDLTIITSFSNTSIVTFLSYFLPSLALSIVYQKTNHNLVSVYVTHILVNSISLLMIGVAF